MTSSLGGRSPGLSSRNAPAQTTTTRSTVTRYLGRSTRPPRLPMHAMLGGRDDAEQIWDAFLRAFPRGPGGYCLTAFVRGWDAALVQKDALA